MSASPGAMARLFASQHGLITRAQALDHGLRSHQIDHLRKQHRWESVHTGVYRLAGSPVTWRQGLFAVCLAAGDGAAVSHRAAARLWDLSVSGDHIEISIPSSRRIGSAARRFIGPSCLGGAIDDCSRASRRPAWRTIVDLAAVLPLHELETLVDEALTRRLISVTALVRRLDALGTKGRKGSRTLAQLLAARPSMSRAPESPFETRLERAIRDAGLTLPVRQYRVRLPNGRFVRLDFAYPEACLGGGGRQLPVSLQPVGLVQRPSPTQ